MYVNVALQIIIISLQPMTEMQLVHEIQSFWENGVSYLVQKNLILHGDSELEDHLLKLA